MLAYYYFYKFNRYKINCKYYIHYNIYFYSDNQSALGVTLSVSDCECTVVGHEFVLLVNYFWTNMNNYVGIGL